MKERHLANTGDPAKAQNTFRVKSMLDAPCLWGRCLVKG